MNKEEIDSKIDFIEEILDNMDKKDNTKEEHSLEEYKTLENKYNEEISKREKLEVDYQNLFQKYKDRFSESVSTNSTRVEPEKRSEEPKEEVVLDIRSIF